MNIIIPAAGRGKRFSDVGFNVPKPFIPCGLSKMTMLEMVINNLFSILENRTNTVVVILQKAWLTEYREEIERLQDWFNDQVYVRGLDKTYLRIATVNEVTEGPCCTALLANEYLLNRNDPCLITGCDQYVPYGLNEWINFTKKRNAAGSLLTFCHTDPRWSYVKSNEYQEVTECAEKRPISNFANTGLYYFRSWDDFIYYSSQMIASNERVNNEFYIAPVYNYFIKDNQKIVHYFINEFYGTGTPEDLNIFQQYISEAKNE
jgi:NDP-sugar pyrophosphorylase family protein